MNIPINATRTTTEQITVDVNLEFVTIDVIAAVLKHHGLTRRSYVQKDGPHAGAIITHSLFGNAEVIKNPTNEQLEAIRVCHEFLCLVGRVVKEKR